MLRTSLVILAAVSALAAPAAAGAQTGGPPLPMNIYACRGLVVALGDHPQAAPPVFAAEIGVPVAEAIQFARTDSGCA